MKCYYFEQVWPAIFITLLLSGPVLFLFVSERDYKGRKKRNKKQIFMDCVWITFTIFLQQGEETQYLRILNVAFFFFLQIIRSLLIDDNMHFHSY